MKKFDIIRREMALDCRWMPVEKQLVRLPDGNECEWFVGLGTDVVIVIPVLVNGQVLLQRAYKHGSGEVIHEFCAGMIDQGETHLQAAERELLEETGYVAKNLIPLGSAFANPTGSGMKYHFFLAEQCVKQQEPQLESAEQIINFPVENLDAAADTLLNDAEPASMAAIAALAFARAALPDRPL